MLLAYRKGPSFFAVGQRVGMHIRLFNAASGRWPIARCRPLMTGCGRITPEAKAWLVSLVCDNANDQHLSA